MTKDNKLYIKEVCQRCTDKQFCSGLCKEINDYLISERKRKEVLQYVKRNSF